MNLHLILYRKKRIPKQKNNEKQMKFYPMKFVFIGEKTSLLKTNKIFSVFSDTCIYTSNTKY